MSNLTNFPPVYYVTLEDSVVRQIDMESQLESLGVFDYTRIVAFDGRVNNYCENPNIYGPHKDGVDSGQIATVMSHLKAIATWYWNSDTPTAVFLEDDMILSTCQYWTFTWDDIVERLNRHQWNCIQLSLIRADDAMVPLNEGDIQFRRRSFYNWSAGSYMITREYAKVLLDHYVPVDGELNLSIYGYPEYFPYIENVLYVAGRPHEYTLPLFVENTGYTSTFYQHFPKGMVGKHKQGQVHSSAFVHNWWKENGHRVNIDELMTFKETWYWDKG